MSWRLRKPEFEISSWTGGPHYRGAAIMARSLAVQRKALKEISTPALAAFDLANLSEGGDQSGVEGLSPRDSRRISLVWLAGGMSCSLEPEQELSVLSGAGRIAKGIKQSP